HVVQLPPPAPTRGEVEPHLHLRLVRRIRDRDVDVALHVFATGLPDGGPGLAAIDTEVHGALLATDRVEVGVEPDLRAVHAGQVHPRRHQAGVLDSVDAVVVGVDDGEVAGPAGEVAAVPRVVELPGLAAAGVVDDAPAVLGLG